VDHAYQHGGLFVLKYLFLIYQIGWVYKMTKTRRNKESPFLRAFEMT
jgi:hypothetical protein